MKNLKNTNLTSGAAYLGLVLALGLTGCKGSDKQMTHGEKFVCDDTPRTVDKFANAQIASGARYDATLNAAHFDGSHLNSLGRQKVRAMLRDDDACEPLVVYLDLPKTDETKARQEAVSGFLMDEGLLESQIAFKAGSNPNAGGTAAAGLKALAALEAGPAEAGATSAAPAPAPIATPTK